MTTIDPPNRTQRTTLGPAARSRTTLESVFGGDPLAEVATWDPEDESTIREALQGVAAVVYLVGVPYTDFHLHPVLMRRVIDAAIEEKVDRPLLIGTLYVFGKPQRARVTEDHPREHNSAGVRGNALLAGGTSHRR